MLKSVFFLISIPIFIVQLHAQNETLFKGKWSADSFFTTFEGSWSIEERDGVKTIIMGQDFEAKKAPDLKIFLSKLELKDINGDNASDNKSSVYVGDLKKYKGTITIAIPADINIKDYKTILVHCEKYSKFWGGSSLR